MLTPKAKNILLSLDSGTTNASDAEKVLTLISKINVVLRHASGISGQRLALLGKLRDKLSEGYQRDRLQLAHLEFVALTANRLLESL
jgi:hypothetical protein